MGSTIIKRWREHGLCTWSYACGLASRTPRLVLWCLNGGAAMRNSIIASMFKYTSYQKEYGDSEF